jgi:predicted MFS family arabinose efflux permease
VRETDFMNWNRYANAALARLPSIVPPDQLESANGRLFATQTIANELAGPPLGSVIFSAIRAAPFALAASVYALSSGVIALIDGAFEIEGTADQQNIREAIREGVSWFWGHRVLRAAGLIAGAVNFVSAATFSVFVLFAQDILGVSDAAYGVIIAFGAVGGIIGSLSANRFTQWFGSGRTLFLDILLNGIAFIVISLTTNPLVVGLMFIVISMSNMVGNVILISFRQTVIPDRLLGRVASAYRLIVMGALPLGALFGGIAADTLGLVAPYRIGGIGLIFVAFAGITVVNNQSMALAKQEAEYIKRSDT